MIFEHDLDTWGATLAYDEGKGYSGKEFFRSEGQDFIAL